MRLTRHLGLWGGVGLGVAAMMGGSVFTLTGFVSGLTGSSLPIAVFLTAALAALPTILIYAELGAARPEAGGGYLWIREGLGPIHGHFAGWFSWCAHSVACAVYALSFGFYATHILDGVLLPLLDLTLPGPDELWRPLFALGAIVVLSTVNYRGVRHTDLFGRVAILISVGILLFFVALGFLSIFLTPPTSQPASDFMPFGVGGVLAGMGLVFLAFQGFEVVAQAGEEMKEPGRNVPKVMFLSFAGVLGLYLLVTIVVIFGVKADVPSWRILSEAGEGAMVAAAGYFPLPRLLVPLITFGGAGVALAALNATIFSASHVFYAMAHQGRSLPAEFETLHPKYGTPFAGILASACLMILLIVILPIRDVAAIADLLFFFIFAQVHVAFIQFRRKYPDLRRPFRAPFYPWLSIATLLVFTILAFQIVKITPWALAFYLAWLIMGMLIHRVYVERHESGEFARHKIVEFSERVSEASGYLVLVPVIFRTVLWKEMLPFAAALAKQNNGEIFVLAIVSHPTREEGHWPESVKKQDIAEFHTRIAQELANLGVTYTVRAQLSANIADTVLLAVQKLDADLLFMPYEFVPGPDQDNLPRERGIPRRHFRRVLRESRCDLLMFNTIPRARVRRLLVPVARSNHNALLGNVAWSLASTFNAEITLLHASEEGAEDPGEWDRLMNELKPPQNGVVVTKRWLTGKDVPSSILEASDEFNLTIMSAKKISTFGAAVVGPTARHIIEGSQKPVFVCSTHLEFPASIPLGKLFGGITKWVTTFQKSTGSRASGNTTP